MRIGLIALMALALGGVASAVPLSDPPTLTITPPAADLPPEVAALSGVWGGTWDGQLPCRLAVEELTRDAAEVVYAWGDFPGAPARGGWIRRRAAVLPGGRLQWEGRLNTSHEPVTFTFTLAGDRTHLRGERRFHETWRVSMATLRPMAPAQDPSHSLLLGLDTPPDPPGEGVPGGPAPAAFDDFADTRPGPRVTEPMLERFRIDRYRAAIPRAEGEVRAREAALGPTHPDVARALSHLAELYMDQGRYAEAEPLQQRALAIREQVFGPTHLAVAMSLHSLGMFHMGQGRYAEAEPLHRRALAIREQALGPAHPAVASSLNSLAGVARALRRYLEAESLQQRALAIQEAALGPAHARVASSLNNLALLYMGQGRYAEAEPLHRRALAIGEASFGPSHPTVATYLTALARLAHEQRRYTEAEPLHRRALAIREQALGPAHPAVASSLGNLATVLTRQHRLAEAQPLFERARQIALAMSHVNAALEEESYRGLSRRYSWNLRAYVELLAALAREPPSPSAPALTAFVVVEQVRLGAVQLALARAGARAATAEPSTATLMRRVEELRRRQRALWQQLSEASTAPGGEGDAEQRAALQHALQEADRELAGATSRLHEAFPRYAELTALAPIDIPTVQALLHRDEALVSWFTLDDRVLIWLVRPGQVPVYRDVPVAKADLRALVSRVRGSLEQGPWQPFDVAQAHALYGLLLAPLRAQLAGVTHLLLVPDDILRPVPFGALVTEATGQPFQRLAEAVTSHRRPTAADLAAYAQLPWLAHDYALTALPSATALRTLRQRPPLPGEPGEPFLGFGDPLLQGDGGTRGGGPMPAARGAGVPLEVLRRLPRLSETGTELSAIAAALGADPKRALYVGERATEPMLQALHRSGRLGRARVLAFATHALLAGELTGLTQPALVLTPPMTASDEDDGLLTLEDIVGLSLPHTSWVVLSACHTAADDGSGEALSGLARAFFHAGAAALLVSQWSVDDVATRVLMTEVFRRQAAAPDLPRAEALRQGMLAVMAQARGRTAYFAHPYAWAPFVLVGEGGRGRP